MANNKKQTCAAGLVWDKNLAKCRKKTESEFQAAETERRKGTKKVGGTKGAKKPGERISSVEYSRKASLYPHPHEQRTRASFEKDRNPSKIKREAAQRKQLRADIRAAKAKEAAARRRGRKSHVTGGSPSGRKWKKYGN